MSEHLEQVKVIQWTIRNRVNGERIKDYLFSIPNGGLRNMKVAMKLKAEGVTRGVSDLFLAYPNDGYHGLWIEMKVKGGKVSKEQAAWLERMEGVGYKAAVCYGHEEAIKELQAYLASQTLLTAV